MSLIHELRRRNVFRIGAAYLVSAWLLIQVAETIFPLFGFDNTPARIVVVVLAIGFVPALVLAWVFEFSGQGLTRDREVDHEEAALQPAGNKLDRVIVVMLVLALAYFAVDKFLLSPHRHAELVSRDAVKAETARRSEAAESLVEIYGNKSIAVLPFINISSDASDEFFSDGITEELITLLSKIPQLWVISRTSAFSYKGKRFKLAEVAEELGVANILEGSVRKVGDQVRVAVKLIEARSERHLWAETFDRTVGDIFAIQDEIAATVVKELNVTLLQSIPSTAKTDPEAYALYLQARYLNGLGTTESLEQSEVVFRQALAIDPHYAPAWDGLATSYVNRAGGGLLPIEEGSAQAREAAGTALAIDPGYAPAYATLGWISMYHDNDPADAARYFQRALELDPLNTRIVGNAASLLQSLGRTDEAIELEKIVAVRDPLHPAAHNNLGLSYLAAGQYEAAIVALQTALRLSPGRIGVYSEIGMALLLKGEPAAALAAMEQEPSEPFRLLGLVMAHHALGDAKASDAALAVLVEKYEQEWAYNIAYVLAFRDEADLAFEWLGKAVDYGDPGLPGIAGQPEFDKLRDDPRWLAFMESIGRAPEQLGAIEFRVTVP